MSEKKPHSSGALINYRNSWLFMLRDDNSAIPHPNKLGIIGGKGEEEEKPERTIERETKEEIGVDLQDNQVKYLGIIDGNSPHDRHLFQIGLNDNQIQTIQKGVEGQALVWLDRKQIEEGVIKNQFVPDLPSVLEKYVLS